MLLVAKYPPPPEIVSHGRLLVVLTLPFPFFNASGSFINCFLPGTLIPVCFLLPCSLVQSYIYRSVILGLLYLKYVSTHGIFTSRPLHCYSIAQNISMMLTTRLSYVYFLLAVAVVAGGGGARGIIICRSHPRVAAILYTAGIITYRFY